MKNQLNKISISITHGALLYRLTREETFRDLALKALMNLATLDLAATSYRKDHVFHHILAPMAVGLDFLWDSLGAREREEVIAVLLSRAREFHPLSVEQAFKYPLDSHAVHYGLPTMTFVALALFHEEPEAETWLGDVLRYLEYCWPGLGGDDGGWAQGFGYGELWSVQRMMHMIYVATEINFFNSPWSRHNGNHLLYFQPPYGNCPTFGDGSYNRPKGLQKQVMMVYAAVHQNPHYQWFAEQIESPLRGPHDYLLSHFFYWGPPPPAKAPEDLPQAIHMKDIDWVALHCHLADKDRNVMLQFKSSHFGSFNHSHADQNSFVLEAYGQPLLIDSGYYPMYGSPHDVTWTRQTRAHNSLLINGKGQGAWNRAAAGRIAAFVHTPDFDYVAGDATAAYQQPSRQISEDQSAFNEGIVRVVRHILFVRPDTFVILDDVETEKPATLQLLFHGLCPFHIDEANRVIRITQGPALARIHILEPGPVTFSQTDQFSTPPESGEWTNQWHLTCSFPPDGACRRLLTCITVGRSHGESRLPTVERIESIRTLGARIGDTGVLFRLNPASVGMTCRGVRADGTATNFACSGPGTS
ncbi:MAG: heparinase II/III family protein [Armatimonadetes bacterium]|nr:heparinase II/III family protein [Planctomycetota bacterium]MBI2200493.1 heparinase II/III family protein [Armatimonadota bacterium]